MKLNYTALKDTASWEKGGFSLPAFDVQALKEKTRLSPAWLHLGAGNIFRAFPAADLQTLIDKGLYDTGLVVAECFDGEIIDKAYTPFDCLSVLCVLKSDGTVEKKVIASVCEALRCDGQNPAHDDRLQQVLAAPSLQMVSLAITEKGYAVTNAPSTRSFCDQPMAICKTAAFSLSPLALQLSMLTRDRGKAPFLNRR